MRMRQSFLHAALPIQRPARWIVPVALLAAAVLAACSTNGGGGSVTIANSQPPDSQTTDFGIVYVKRTVPTGTRTTCGCAAASRHRPICIC